MDRQFKSGKGRDFPQIISHEVTEIQLPEKIIEEMIEGKLPKKIKVKKKTTKTVMTQVIEETEIKNKK